MNYDQARPLKDGGWHWTSMNDGEVRTAAPCITVRLADPEPGKPPEIADIRRCEPHATREEAERHFYDFCLENLVEQEWESAHRCDMGCGVWTNKTLGNQHLGRLFPGDFLCDFHRRRDVVEDLHPFTTGIALAHS